MLTALNRKVETGGEQEGPGRIVCVGFSARNLVEGSVPTSVWETPGREESARHTCSVKGQLLAVNHPHDVDLVILLGHTVLQKGMRSTHAGRGACPGLCPCRARRNPSTYPTLSSSSSQ